jgi:hypothetical protein
MRSVVSVVSALLIALAGSPTGVLAGQDDAPLQAGLLTGTARRSNQQPLAGARVQIRNLAGAEIAATTISGPSGEFSFPGVAPGTYILEVVEAGRIIGLTAPFTLAAGATLTVTVVATGHGTAPGSDRGFRLFGLGPLASAGVLGAAGAAAVTAIVSTRENASPSR